MEEREREICIERGREREGAGGVERDKEKKKEVYNES